MGKWYDKKIRDVKFEHIHYVNVSDLYEYKQLEGKIDALIQMDGRYSKDRLTEMKIKAQNLLNQAIHDRDLSMSINLPIMALIAGGFYGIIVGIKTDVFTPFFHTVICLMYILFSALWILNRANEILKLRADTVFFYEMIKSILEKKEDSLEE